MNERKTIGATRLDECKRCLGRGAYLHTVRGFGGIAVAFEIRRCACLAGLLEGGCSW